MPTPDDGPSGDSERQRPWAGYVLVLVGLVALVTAGVGALLLGDDDDIPAAPEIASPIANALDAATAAGEPFPGLSETELEVGETCLRLVVADSVDERAQGLRSRSSLGPYDGMMFVFEGTSASSFTMQGVPVPLEVGWYGADGDPVDREEMVPCPDDRTDCPAYSSRGSYRFALETLDGGLPGGALGGCPS